MKILIILTTLNGEQFIYEQLTSILNQKYVDIEVFIFDDCSIDNTINIIQSINDSRIIIYKNKIPSGSAGANFLNAIKSIPTNKLASFDYISFSDQDDIWYSNKLYDACNLLSLKNSELYCSNLLLWNQFNDTHILLKKDYKQKRYDFLFEGASAGCTYLLTHNLFNNFKNYLINTNIQYWPFISHDWLIYFYSRLNGFKVIIDAEPKIVYRIHQNNVHGQLNINSISSYFNRLKYVLNGWYFNQISNLITLTKEGSVEKYIYEYYSKNWFTRVFILFQFNFSLIRSKKKFLQFVLISLIPRFNYSTTFKHKKI